MSGDTLVVTTGCVCVPGVQRCCYTPYNAQGSPSNGKYSTPNPDTKIRTRLAGSTYKTLCARSEKAGGGGPHVSPGTCFAQNGPSLVSCGRDWVGRNEVGPLHFFLNPGSLSNTEGYCPCTLLEQRLPCGFPPESWPFLGLGVAPHVVRLPLESTT